MTVCIVPCQSYAQEAVQEAIEKTFKVPDIAAKIPQNGIVLLKPNLLSSTKGLDKPVNTHTAILRGISQYLIDQHNCEIWIGDSCNSLSGHSTRAAFQLMGLNELAKELGVRLIDFNADQTKILSISHSNRWQNVRVALSVFEADLVVSVPKLKTHTLCGCTLSIKNMIGVVQGGEKRKMHAIAPDPKTFAEVVIALFTRVKPGMAIIDGIVGMEGKGPAAGDPVHSGVLIASSYPVKADAVAASYMGIKPLENPIIKAAGERGLGQIDLEKIHVINLSENKLGEKPFKPSKVLFSGWDLLRFFPVKIVQCVMKYFGWVPWISLSRCKGCGTCTKVCPADAISLAEGKARIDLSICQECYCCQELCPYDAVDLKKRHLAGMLMRMRAVHSFIRRKKKK